MKTIFLKILFWAITLAVASLTFYVAIRGFLLWYTGFMIAIVIVVYLISLIPYHFAIKTFNKVELSKKHNLSGWILYSIFLIPNLGLIYGQIIEIGRDHHWAFG